jgi:hypothetical protein
MPHRTAPVAIALLLVGCAARPVGDDANVTTMAEGESSQTDESGSAAESDPTSAGSESESESENESEGDGDEGDGDGDECWEPDKLDLPSDSEAPMPENCTVEWIPWPTPEQYPGCMICELEPGCKFEAYLGCVMPADGESCADICPSGDCLGEYWNACEGESPAEWGTLPSDTCGHYEIDGRCCTIGKFWLFCVE